MRVLAFIEIKTTLRSAYFAKVKFPGQIEHFVDEFLGSLLIGNVVGKVHKQTAVDARIHKFYGRHIDPDALPRPRLYAQVKVRYGAPFTLTLRHVRKRWSNVGSKRAEAVKEFTAGRAQSFLRGVPE